MNKGGKRTKSNLFISRRVFEVLLTHFLDEDRYDDIAISLVPIKPRHNKDTVNSSTDDRVDENIEQCANLIHTSL